MAVYRIFPEKDTFIYTEKPTANLGRNEILEIGGYSIATSGDGQTARTFLKFNTEEIVTGVQQSGLDNPTASINMFLAFGGEVPVEYNLVSAPLAESWDEGIGKLGDTPTNTSGCSWTYRSAGGANNWSTDGNLVTQATGSTIPIYPGGGYWYTGSISNKSVISTQSFTKVSSQDVEIDVKNAIEEIYLGNITNHGFVVKLEDSLEFNLTSSIRLKYYGSDTNTIYPPYLELKWDDSSYVTGSLTVTEDTNPIVVFRDGKGEYVNEGKRKFRLFVRDRYPTRTFTTSSIYSTTKVLPATSYYGIRDENTEEMVVDFDVYNTKISADSTSNYFFLYMDSFQPERYYRLLVKSLIDGSTVVVDNNMVFKVVRNG